MANCKERSCCLFMLILVIVVDQLQIPSVSCQVDDSTRCFSRKTFDAFLRLPGVSSNLAAYSRTARIIQDARNDFIHLKNLGAQNDDNDDGKICIPSIVYYEIFSDPTMQPHLFEIARAQGIFDSEKRSIATLAKNGDLPISIHDRGQEGQEDGEKRSEASMSPEDLLKLYVGDSFEEREDKTAADIISEYTLPNGELDVESLTRDYHSGKRNVAALARDYALPSGRRNIATMARELALTNGKRNVGALARDRMLPNGKRSYDYPLDKFYVLPMYAGKRNIASIARDYPGDYSSRGFGKRGIASLARNSDFPYPKRNVGTLARDWSLPQSRHGRSLNDNNDNAGINGNGFNQFEAQLTDVKNKSRSKRQADYSEEYPLPVMQNTNVLDYDDIIEAIANGFPIAAKRFMGAGASLDDWQDDDDDTLPMGYHGSYQPSKRHIGALARLGWLPSFRAARFSRSPRYLVDREDSADGTTSDNTSNSSTRSLNPHRRGTGTRYAQSLKGDCRHGFRRYLLIPKNDRFIDEKLRYSTINF